MSDFTTKQKLDDEINRLCALYNKGDIETVLSQVSELLDHFSDSAALYIIEGDANAKLQRFHSAIKSYRKAIHLIPGFALPHFNLGVVYQDKGDLDSAIKSYQNALAIESEDPKIYNNLGLIYRDKDELRSAVKCFEKVIQLNPRIAEVYNNLGVINLKLKSYNLATDNFRRAVELKSDFFSSLYNLGVTIQETQGVSFSLPYFKKAINLDPDSAIINLHDVTYIKGKFSNVLDAYNYIGLIFLEEENLDLAIKSFKRILHFNPNIAEVYNNLGTVFLKKREYDFAEKNFTKTIKLNPNFAGGYYNMGTLMENLGDFESARRYFLKAIDIDPDCAKTNLYNVTHKKTKSTNLWKPGNYERVLLWEKNQGIGDEVRLASVFTEMKEHCSDLLIQIDSRLIPLFTRSFSQEMRFYPKEKDISKHKYDKHLPLAHLPEFFRPNRESYERTSKGWLYASPKKINDLRFRLNSITSKYLIGISWRTSGVKDSISLDELARSLPTDEVALVNLQYGNVSDEIETLFNNYGIKVLQLPEVNNNQDLDGLAALICACDEIVSVDNITIQLAGSLGKKSTVLLPYMPSFVWTSDLASDKSHWHSSVTKIKQNKILCWNLAMNKLRKNLDQSIKVMI